MLRELMYGKAEEADESQRAEEIVEKQNVPNAMSAC
jgi:hypothetical protein